MHNRAKQAGFTLLILAAGLMLGAANWMGTNGWLICLILGGGVLITGMMMSLYSSPASAVTGPFRNERQKNDADVEVCPTSQMLG
jgi:hypothetical protein